jgi:DHA1 family tetracycline resistance protein-like MFS transporter
MLGLNMAAGSLARMVGPLLAGSLFGLAIGGPYWFGAVLMLPAIWLAMTIATRQAGGLIDSLAFGESFPY